jgi:hypothetical protein
MSLRVLIAGVAGGILMFIWSFVAHDLLSLGQMGISTMANDAPALSALQGATGDKDGLYMFPAYDMHAKDKGAEMKAWEAKAKAGPSGMVIYHPAGMNREMSAATIVSEGVKEIIVSILAALLLSLTTLTRFWSRAGFVAVVGLIATLTTNPSYWIWYGFPTDYTLGYMLTEWIGYVVAGIAIAALLRPRLRVEI